MIIDEAFNADKLIEFLQALIKDASKKVFLSRTNGFRARSNWDEITSKLLRIKSLMEAKGAVFP